VPEAKRQFDRLPATVASSLEMPPEFRDMVGVPSSWLSGGKSTTRYPIMPISDRFWRSRSTPAGPAGRGIRFDQGVAPDGRARPDFPKELNGDHPFLVGDLCVLLLVGDLCVLLLIARE